MPSRAQLIWRGTGGDLQTPERALAEPDPRRPSSFYDGVRSCLAPRPSSSHDRVRSRVSHVDQLASTTTLQYPQPNRRVSHFDPATAKPGCLLTPLRSHYLDSNPVDIQLYIQLRHPHARPVPHLPADVRHAPVTGLPRRLLPRHRNAESLVSRLSATATLRPSSPAIGLTRLMLRPASVIPG